MLADHLSKVGLLYRYSRSTVQLYCLAAVGGRAPVKLPYLYCRATVTKAKTGSRAALSSWRQSSLQVRLRTVDRGFTCTTIGLQYGYCGALLLGLQYVAELLERCCCRAAVELHRGVAVDLLQGYCYRIVAGLLYGYVRAAVELLRGAVDTVYLPQSNSVLVSHV